MRFVASLKHFESFDGLIGYKLIRSILVKIFEVLSLIDLTLAKKVVQFIDNYLLFVAMSLLDYKSVAKLIFCLILY